ncbi:MAG: hypothetical protein KAY24_09245, partial [Candidatus Eisenbacteria sp.]|nr:hypothetical protein [Candidatus Eisenbacteria bacterium]
MTILLIGLALIFGCSEDEEQRLYRLAPDLGRDVAQRLVAHDDAAFADYSREAGIKEMIDARLALRRGLSFGAAASYTESAAYLMPYIGRVSERLSADYGCHDYLHDYDFWMSLPHDQAAELGCLESEMNDTYLDPDLLLVEKIPRLQRYASAFRTAGYWMGVAVAEYATAEFMSSLGRDEERMQHLRAALALARREGLTIMTCQILGVVGKIHRSAGRIDSMAICWNEALGIASEHRLPEHAANINSLYANHYADAGRLALAADLHHAAMQVCREYKGGYLELPFIIEAMYFHAELGFWEVVRHLLQRARVLNREYARSPRILQRKVNAVRLDEMEARYLCAQGKTQEAEEIFCRLEEEIRGLP